MWINHMGSFITQKGIYISVGKAHLPYYGPIYKILPYKEYQPLEQ
jgi:hypothetical protein